MEIRLGAPALFQCREHGIQWFDWDDARMYWRCPKEECSAFVSWEVAYERGWVGY